MSVTGFILNAITRSITKSITGTGTSSPFNRLEPLLWMKLEDDLALTNGTGVATFSRVSVANYVDKADGLLKQATLNAPRFEAEGYLRESTMTNIALHSNTLTNAVWQNFATTTVVQSGDNSLGIDSFHCTMLAAGNVMRQDIIVTAGDVLTISFYVKNIDSSVFNFAVRGKNPDTLLFEEDYTSQVNTQSFTRVSFTVTIEQSSDHNFDIFTNSGQANETFLISQVDIVKADRVSSPIYTGVSPVTRLEDELTVPITGNYPTALTDDVSFSATVDPIGIGLVPDYGIMFGVSGGTLGGYRMVSVLTAFDARFQEETTPQAIAPLAGSGTFDMAVVLDTSNTIYVDGVSNAVARTSPLTYPSQIDIGFTDQGNNDGLVGHIKDFQIYDVALTAEEVPLLPNVPIPTTPPVAGNLIVNGDFDEGTTNGWVTTQGADSFISKSGTAILSTSATGYASYAFDTVIGEDYDISALFKDGSTTSGGFAAIRVADDTDASVNVATIVQNDASPQVGDKAGAITHTATATTTYIVVQGNNVASIEVDDLIAVLVIV